MINEKKAFTVGEMLMTMTILGVVATLSIIVILPDTQGKETLVKVQRAYSILSNAYENASTKYGPILDWDAVNSHSFGETMANQMLIAANCKTQTDLTTVNDCIPGCPKIYKTTGTQLDVCTSSDVSKLMTNDGFSYAFQIESQSCDIDVTNNAPKAPFALKQVCGTAMTDLYSKKKGQNKNIYGADLFLFYITREGIYPVGLTDDVKFPYSEEKCKKTITENTPGCTAKYIYDKTKIKNE